MKILVLYDSFFGNTEKIAQAIATELGRHHEVSTIKVNTANVDQLQHLDLLFVGSPTRAFSSSPAMTTFLKALPEQSLAEVKVAVFDTRMAPEDVKPRLLGFATKLAGYADKKILKQLRASGAEVVLPTQGFLVMNSEGPLKDGEIERAETWAKSIAAGVEVRKY
jgi:flavodoxin I